jgi:hypothetical protein
VNPDTGDIRPIELDDVRPTGMTRVAPGDDLMDARTRMLDLRPGDRLPDALAAESTAAAARISDGDRWRRHRDARRRKQKARRRRNGRG